MMLEWPVGWALAVMLVLASSAHAQRAAPTPPQAGPSQEQPDPRLAGPTIAALTALVALREAELRAMAQDSAAKLAKRESEWSAYSEPLWKKDEPK